MRPGQPVNRGARRRHGRQANGHNRISAAPQNQAVQQREGQAHNDHADGYHASQPAMRVNPGERHVPQPLPGKPGLVGHRKREHVLVRDAVIGQDPFPGPNMPARIAIPEHGANAIKLGEQEQQRDDEGRIRQRGHQVE
jgi:hypothetical protein